MSSIIKVENLGKKYTIKHEQAERYVALRDVLTHRAKKIFSFPPKLRHNNTKPSSEDFWALKDLNFEIQQGDRVGIIGRNGAGKSTLLKILSRITEPSTGRIELNGRVASLLEVGTGFHPELTGRENIFLNGAILGMSRQEIKSKFDEIVDFSGVEKFLDTPVKRYSSGMYVRLAFAVAAHLEPEILIVDEVLAVGDAEFQKKCLGKMEDVSKNEGRTVLFVSHNMNIIQSICNTGFFLGKGSIITRGNVNTCISTYLKSGNTNANKNMLSIAIDTKRDSQIFEAELINENNQIISSAVHNKSSLFILAKYIVNKKIYRWHLVYYIRNENGEIIFFSDRTDFHGDYMIAETGYYTFKLKVPIELLLPGDYYISLYSGNEDSGDTYSSEDALFFKVENIDIFRTQKRDGYIFHSINWELITFKPQNTIYE